MLLVFGAGVISTFSPCILPILPVFVAFQLASRKRAVLINIGLVTSFALLGAITGGIGGFLTTWRAVIEEITYIAMVIFGLFLLIDRLNMCLAKLSSTASNFLGRRVKNLGGDIGSLFIGFILGIMWSPCPGPLVGTLLIYTIMLGGPLEGLLVMIIYATGFALSMYVMAQIFKKQRRG